MIDWKKFAAEHGDYMTARKDGRLYIVGPDAFRAWYAIRVDTDAEIEPCGNADNVASIEKMFEKNKRANLIPLSNIIGDALDGYEQRMVECDCIDGTCYECEGDGQIEYMDCRNVTYDIECPVCSGSGILRGKGYYRDCVDCDGNGFWMEWPRETITHEGRHFAKAVLKVLSLLPGAQVSLGATTNSEHYFQFEGGDGVFMGLIRPYES